MVEKIKAEQGFSVTRAELYLEGYCPSCTEERGRRKNGSRVHSGIRNPIDLQGSDGQRRWADGELKHRGGDVDVA
jgi:hypothetical protein